MSVTPMRKLYTDAQVAEMLHVSPVTIGRLRRTRRIGYTHVGKKVYITDRDIDEYLESQRCTAISSSEKKTAFGTSGSTTTAPGLSASIALAREIAGKPSKS